MHWTSGHVLRQSSGSVSQAPGAGGGHGPRKASPGGDLLPDSLLWRGHVSKGTCEYGFQLSPDPRFQQEGDERDREAEASFVLLPDLGERCHPSRRVEIVRRGPAHCQGGRYTGLTPGGERGSHLETARAGQRGQGSSPRHAATSGGSWAGDRPLEHLMAVRNLRPRPSQTYWPAVCMPRPALEELGPPGCPRGEPGRKLTLRMTPPCPHREET